MKEVKGNEKDKLLVLNKPQGCSVQHRKDRQY